MLASPDCPHCGHPPQVLLATQAFCGNDECDLLMWNPTLTPAQLSQEPQDIIDGLEW